MRKYFALWMVGVLALTLSLAVASCTKKSDEGTTTTTTTTTTTESMPDTSMAPADTMAH